MKTLKKLKSLITSPSAAPIVIAIIGILLQTSFSVASTGSQVVLGGATEQGQFEGRVFDGGVTAVNPIGDDLSEIGEGSGPVGMHADSVTAGGIFGPAQETPAKTTVATTSNNLENHCNLRGYWPNGFVRPAPGPVGVRHGHIDPVSGERIGVDIPNRLGTTVVASGSGTVIRAEYGWSGGYGNVVEIDHGNGLKTLYAHLNDILVAVGDYKTKGEPVGFMGETGNATGPHVHFEVRCNYN